MSLLGQLGTGNYDEDISIGAIIYSDAFPYYYNYYDDDDYYYYYPNYYRPVYQYNVVISEANTVKALIGDDKFVKSGDDYKLTLTLEDYLATQDDNYWYTIVSEFDINVTIKMKDGEIAGFAGKFAYRESTYYGYDDTRYAGEFDISPEEICISFEIHTKNKMKVLIEVTSKTAETDAAIPGAPPEGDKVIPYEDLFEDDDDYYPNVVVPLMGYL